MQTLQQRDEKSIRIFIGLFLGALVTAVGLFLLRILDEAFNLSSDLSGFVVSGAVLVAFIYLSRHRRP